MGTAQTLLTIYLIILMAGDLMDVEKYDETIYRFGHIGAMVMQYTTIFGLLYWGKFYG